MGKMMRRILLVSAIGFAGFAAPALAQSFEAPRFEALEQQQQQLEQQRYDRLENQRVQDQARALNPNNNISKAEQALRELETRDRFRQLDLQGQIERQPAEREQQIREITLPNRFIPETSNQVISAPESFNLPRAPAGQYYARVEGKFVLVDRGSGLVASVLPSNIGDPTSDIPMGPRPPVAQPLPTNLVGMMVPFTSDRAILNPSMYGLSTPPAGYYYARVDEKIALVDAASMRITQLMKDEAKPVDAEPVEAKKAPRTPQVKPPQPAGAPGSSRQ